MMLAFEGFRVGGKTEGYTGNYNRVLSALGRVKY